MAPAPGLAQGVRGRRRRGGERASGEAGSPGPGECAAPCQCPSSLASALDEGCVYKWRRMGLVDGSSDPNLCPECLTQSL